MSAARRLLDTLPVASLLIYPSRPQTAADREARSLVVSGIKQGRPSHVQRVALRLSQMALEDPVRRLVPTGAVLVPVPRSVPLSAGGLWPALELANALLAAGVGSEVAPILERTEPVRRSAGARTAQEREPPLKHYETIRVAPLGFEDAAPLVLIDDVVTTGSTLIACASLLRERAPASAITAFAAARADRTTSLQYATEILAPRAETISLFSDGGRPRRA